MPETVDYGEPETAEEIANAVASEKAVENEEAEEKETVEFNWNYTA